MNIEYGYAPPDFADDYIRLRGLTRENKVSEERLRTLGITAQSWADDIRSSELQGTMAVSNQNMIGYCFGNTRTGEAVVLAVLPAFEGRGIGQRLLASVVELLRQRGHTRLFLGCSRDPAHRSHGFYRHLGWRSTGGFDDFDDEILELLKP